MLRNSLYLKKSINLFPFQLQFEMGDVLIDGETTGIYD